MSELFPVLGRKIHSVVFSAESRSSRKLGAGLGRKALDELVAGEIHGDLERVHSRARSVMGYKRKEMALDLSEPGSGRLMTPDFDYHVQASLGDDEIHWQREVSFAGEDKALGNDRVLDLFGQELDTVVVRFAQPIDVAELIDSVEERDVPGVSLDYDMLSRWCEVTIEGTPALVRVEEREVRISREPGTLTSLAEMLALIRPLRA